MKTALHKTGTSAKFQASVLSSAMHAVAGLAGQCVTWQVRFWALRHLVPVPMATTWHSVQACTVLVTAKPVSRFSTFSLLFATKTQDCFCAAVTCQDSVLMSLWLARLGEALKGIQYYIGHFSTHRGFTRTVTFWRAHGADTRGLTMFDRRQLCWQMHAEESKRSVHPVCIMLT